MGTPIINLPQTGVLGLHAIKDKPVAINGRVEIRPVRWDSFCHRLGFVSAADGMGLAQMMYLALTYDHRLLDGREAVTFLVKVGQSYVHHLSIYSHLPHLSTCLFLVVSYEDKTRMGSN